MIQNALAFGLFAAIFAYKCLAVTIVGSGLDELPAAFLADGNKSIIVKLNKVSSYDRTYPLNTFCSLRPDREKLQFLFDVSQDLTLDVRSALEFLPCCLITIKDCIKFFGMIAHAVKSELRCRDELG